MTATRSPAARAASHAWPDGPARPLLPAGCLHVWRADLEDLDERLGELLCAEEQARAAGILGERRRLRFTRARGLLRALLAGYLAIEPRRLRFSTGPHGKPALEPATHGARAPGRRGASGAAIEFNLSHSGGTALFAIAAMGPVGVDVEVARRALDAVAIAARTFGPAEARRLATLTGPAREQEFLRLWTRNEARLKCIGVGLSSAPDPAPAPWIAELPLGPGAAAAVAALQAPEQVSCWQWPSRRGPGPARGSSRRSSA